MGDRVLLKQNRFSLKNLNFLFVLCSKTYTLNSKLPMGHNFTGSIMHIEINKCVFVYSALLFTFVPSTIVKTFS